MREYFFPVFLFYFIHPKNVDLMQMFCLLLFALLWILYITYKMSSHRKIQKNKHKKEKRKQQKYSIPWWPSVMPTLSLFFSHYSHFYFCILRIGKKCYIWKVGWGIDPKVLTLPEEIWPFACFLFFRTVLRKHNLYFFSKWGHDPYSREMHFCLFVCTTADVPTTFLCRIMKCNP